MPFDFPNSPTTGQLYEPAGGPKYKWDGTAWVKVAIVGADGPQGPPGANGAAGAQGPAGPGVPVGGATGQVLAKTSGTDYATAWVPSAPAVGLVDIGDTPPVSPVDRQLFWESDTGGMFIRFNDGNTAQWVQVNPGGLSDAVSDGKAYGRLNGVWTQVLPITGGTLTGDLTLPNLAFSNAMMANGQLYLGATGTFFVGRASYAMTNTLGLSYHPANGFLVECQNAAPFIANKIGANGAAQLFYHAGTAVGSITVANSSSTAYNTTSDGRLKEDRQDFDAGPIIDALEVFDFQWKGQEARGHGIIAQDAVEVFPEAIFHDEEADTWGADYSKLVPLLLQEVKALRARVAELEAR